MFPCRENLEKKALLEKMDPLESMYEQPLTLVKRTFQQPSQVQQHKRHTFSLPRVLIYYDNAVDVVHVSRR